MAKYFIDGSTLLAIANAIRAKKGTTAKINPANFASEIAGIIGSDVEMQTLTVVNSNNEAETASFRMPSRYWFSQFIGSEYDTSDGAFAVADGAITYNGYALKTSDGNSVTTENTASGTFSYEGEMIITPLSAPTLSLVGDTLSISADSETVDVLVNGTVTTSVTLSQNSGAFDLSTLGLSAGTYTITAIARASEAQIAAGYVDSAESVSVSYAVEEQAEPTTQTLTIINSNNTSESVTFVMPSGYTFAQFVGSDYDTSGDRLSLIYNEFLFLNAVCYDNHSLATSANVAVLVTDVASGTFYYAGEVQEGTTYELSGTWTLNDDLEQPATDLTTEIEFSALGVNDNTSLYKRITFEETEDGHIAMWFRTDGFGKRIFVFGQSSAVYEGNKNMAFEGTQTVSKEFYEWFTANATQTA